jgi:hypothetical protein
MGSARILRAVADIFSDAFLRIDGRVLRKMRSKRTKMCALPDSSLCLR